MDNNLAGLPCLAISSEPVPTPMGEAVLVRKCVLMFRRWQGPPPVDSYGGKACVDLDGEPLFAELAILRLLNRSAWAGVWVDTYRRRFLERMPTQNTIASKLPAARQACFDAICAANGGSRSGCWDVFAWRGDEVLFAESKRQKRDRMRETQYRWLQAAVRTGLSKDSFVVVEWNLL
jgi:hypothetical protein